MHFMHSRTETGTMPYNGCPWLPRLADGCDGPQMQDRAGFRSVLLPCPDKNQICRSFDEPEPERKGGTGLE